MVVVTSPGGGRTLMRRLNRSRSWIIMGTMITVGVVAIALGILGSVVSAAGLPRRDPPVCLLHCHGSLDMLLVVTPAEPEEPRCGEWWQ